MNSKNKNPYDNKTIAIIGLAASLLGIFAFITGFDNIGQIINTLKQQNKNITPVIIPTPTKVVESKIISISTNVPNNKNYWQQVGLIEDTIADIVISEEEIYAATNGSSHGIFKSIDGGENWLAVNNGLGNLNVIKLYIPPQNTNLIFADTENGNWKSLDMGQTWNPLELNFEAFALGSGDGLTLYNSEHTMEIWQSFDGGTNWQETTDTLGNTWGKVHPNSSYCYIIYPSPSNWETVYCQNYHLGSRDIELSISKDKGRSWSPLASIGKQYDTKELALDPRNSATVYACMVDSGLYKSIDAGGSWIPINSDLPNQGMELECKSIIVDPEDTNIIYAAFKNFGVWRTIDGGNHWVNLSNNWEMAEFSIYALAVSSQEPRYLLAGVEENGVWKLMLP